MFLSFLKLWLKKKVVCFKLKGDISIHSILYLLESSKSQKYVRQVIIILVFLISEVKLEIDLRKFSILKFSTLEISSSIPSIIKKKFPASKLSINNSLSNAFVPLREATYKSYKSIEVSWLFNR